MIKISFVGDLICEEEQLIANKLGNSFNFSDIFEDVKQVFLDSDFVVGNLETPIAGEDFKYTNHKWSFNTPLDFALSIKNAGFDLVSTANNHCLDRGVEGLFCSMKNLEKINLDYTGTYLSEKESESVYIKTINGIKMAFISYTYGTNASFNKEYLKKNERFAVNLFRKQERVLQKKHLIRRVLQRLKNIIFKGYTLNNNLIKFKKELKKAKRDADFVFVLMHSGGQYNLIPDKWTVSLMDFLFKNEADVIIGCHPHVVQKVSIKGKDQIGAFSLGNFCSYPGSESSKINQSEYSIILHIYLNNLSKKFEKATFQITKSVIDLNGKAKVHLLYDLIKNEKDEAIRLRLIEDNSLLVNRFLSQQVGEISLENEYLLHKTK